jgi:exopolysaccharide biosynthesis polyprenyl glycosylphosphotransferase
MRDPINRFLADWAKFLALADLAGISAAWTAAWLLSIVWLEQAPAIVAKTHAGLLAAAAAGALAYHWAVQLQDRGMNRMASGKVGAAAAQQSLAVALFIVCFIAVRKDFVISRAFWISLLALLPFWLFSAKFLFLRVSKKIFQSRPRRNKVLVLGTENLVAEWTSWFDSLPWYGFQIKAATTRAAEGCAVEDAALLELLEDLGGELQTRCPSVVICGLCIHGRQVRQLRELVEENGARLLLDMPAMVGTRESISTRAGQLTRLVAFQQEPLASPLNRLLKRVFDIMVSLPVVLFLLPPLALAVWLWQRLVSPGPLLFVQERGGIDGQPFRILKFRSMHVANLDEARQARPGDSRFYPGGSMLRKTSLDEFPQFLNVLMGQMSVIGPRPHMVAHDDKFSRQSRYYRLRQRIKPGITGLAQVQGLRGPLDNAEELGGRLRADLEYAENWNLWLDVQIILRTVLHLFSFHSKSC